MRYTFINPETSEQQTVTIDDAWINKQRSLLGITKREAIYMWLSDEGYIHDKTVQELTAKAKNNGVAVQGKSTKPRKKPVRKPDIIKRALITGLKDYFLEEEGWSDFKIENVEVTNPERIIAFTIGEDNYEIMLSKKRKPKD